MGYRKWPWEYEPNPTKGIGAEEPPVYILEAHSRKDIGRLADLIAGYLPPGGWALEPVFPEAPDETIADAFNLSGFCSLQLQGPPFRQWRESPYDLAYDLLQLTSLLKSVEPDLPSSIFHPVDASMSFLCEEPPSREPTDMAWALRNIRAPEAWKLLTRISSNPGAEILIGQPDTGVADHVDLQNCINTTLGINLIERGHGPTDPLMASGSTGHGTATASVVASRGTVTPTSTGGPGLVTGSAPWSTIVPIRAIRSVIRITQGRVAVAVDHARHVGCHVVSMSLGGLPLRALEAAILRAVHKQVIVVAAAGNCIYTVVWPARYKSVISMAGTNIDDRPWKGSSRGKRVDMSAPAEFVWRAVRQTPVEALDVVKGGQGTSFATALTAGVAALWLAGRRDQLINELPPGCSLQESFRACLQRTARVPAVWDKSNYGAGIVDAKALLDSACTLGHVVGQPQMGRESYASQIDSMYSELSDANEIQKTGPLARIPNLTASDKDYFGHELLALLSQASWLSVVGGRTQMRARLELPSLRPSRQLRRKLKW